jgi:hypothetical protein
MSKFTDALRKATSRAAVLELCDKEDARLAKAAEKRKKPVVKWVAPEDHEWAKPLESVKHVHETHPSEEELTRFWGNNTMVVQLPREP